MHNLCILWGQLKNKVTDKQTNRQAEKQSDIATSWAEPDESKKNLVQRNFVSTKLFVQKVFGPKIFAHKNVCNFSFW